MPKMGFFRRPQLAGTALERPAQLFVRGDLRRNNADNTSSTPYFNTLPAGGGTLLVEHRYYSAGVPVNGSASVTVPANGSGVATFKAVLDAITADLAAIQATAYDAGGCVGIRSNSVNQGDCRLAVTGGTAASGIGFFTTLRSYATVSGDLGSSPEGEIGNQFGSALLTKGENFDSDTVARALGRVMANMDVLYSEALREEVVVKKIGGLNGDGVSTYIDVETVAPGTRVFTGTYVGGGVLFPESERKQLLASYFFLIDPSTMQPAWQAVVDVRVGVTSVLGVEQTVIDAAAITAIPSGDLVQVASTTGVIAGDYALIAGATNGGWRNNGFRWVVEEVVSATTLRLRPMSSRELELVGETAANDVQPIVELSHELGQSETYGSLTVRRSNFTPNARLYLDNVIPLNQQVVVYAAVPQSKRTRNTGSSAAPFRAVSGELVRSVGAQANALLTLPTLAIQGSDLTWTAFWVRRFGRAYRIPLGSMTRPAAERTVAWDVATNSVVALAAPPASESHALGYVYPSPDARGVQQFGRPEVLAGPVLTVGVGGEFPDLQAAALWIRHHANAMAGGTDDQSYEILVLSDQSLSTQLDLGLTWSTHPDIVIRGATSDILIEHPANPLVTDWSYFGIRANTLTLANLTIRIEDPTWLLGDCGGSGTNATISLYNVRRTSTRISVESSVFERQLVGAPSGADGYTFVRVSGDTTFKVIYGTTNAFTQLTLGADLLSVVRMASGVQLDGLSYSDGAITLAQNGQTAGVLTRAQVRTLNGGATSNADALHTHSVLDDSTFTGDAQFTGTVTAPTPTLASQVATKNYVDGRITTTLARVNGGAGVSTISNNPSFSESGETSVIRMAGPFGLGSLLDFAGCIACVSPATGTGMLTLPAGFRPGYQVETTVVTKLSNVIGSAACTIGTDGVVTVAASFGAGDLVWFNTSWHYY